MPLGCALIKGMFEALIVYYSVAGKICKKYLHSA
jgi:hypothetical protein